MTYVLDGTEFVNWGGVLQLKRGKQLVFYLRMNRRVVHPVQVFNQEQGKMNWSEQIQ